MGTFLTSLIGNDNASRRRRWFEIRLQSHLSALLSAVAFLALWLAFVSQTLVVDALTLHTNECARLLRRMIILNDEYCLFHHFRWQAFPPAPSSDVWYKFYVNPLLMGGVSQITFGTQAGSGLHFWAFGHEHLTSFRTLCPSENWLRIVSSPRARGSERVYCSRNYYFTGFSSPPTVFSPPTIIAAAGNRYIIPIFFDPLLVPSLFHSHYLLLLPVYDTRSAIHIYLLHASSRQSHNYQTRNFYRTAYQEDLASKQLFFDLRHK